MSNPVPTTNPEQNSDPSHLRHSLNKRKKSKPIRFEVDSPGDPQKQTEQTEQTAPASPDNKIKKLKIIRSVHSSAYLSLRKRKSKTRVLKDPVPTPSAFARAKEFHSQLGTEFPSIIKTMTFSQVSTGFWLGLPYHFCKTYLHKDAIFVLEDEMGEQWEVKYIAYKVGISAGWKHFVFSHDLVQGDVLVFHLVESTKFKVYIFKGNESNEVEGALNLLNLEAQPDKITPVTPALRIKRNKDPESLSSTAVQKKQKNSPAQISGHSGNNSEEAGSEVLEDYTISVPAVSFEEVQSFEDFHIVIKGVCIDHELPDDVRMSYYHLCSDKKQYLHDGLPESLYHKLVVGIIGELVSIADKIRNCKLTTTNEEFERWDNSLRSFKLLGMNVDFLRERMHLLRALVLESEGAVDITQYVEAEKQHTFVENEMTKTEAKLRELKASAKKLEEVMGHLKPLAEKYEHKLREAADAPW